jgi:hypothetical protein
MSDTKPVMIPVPVITGRLRNMISRHRAELNKTPLLKPTRRAALSGAIAALTVELEDLTTLETNARIANVEVIE